MKKKLLSLFLTIVAMSSMIAGNYTTAQAADNISLNVEYSESICHEQKVYSFTVPKSGYFYYTITPISYTTDGEEMHSDAWYIAHEMYVNYKKYEDSKAYYRDGTWRSFRYNFKKGTKVQIKINETSSAENVWYYKVKVFTGKVSNFEKENNGTKSKANTIRINKSFTGNMLKDDVDYWVFKAPKTGRYKISGVISDNDYYGTESKHDDSAYLNASSYLGYKKRGSATLDEVSGYKNIFKGKLKKGQKVYIKIQYDNWYDMFYKIKAKKY